MTDLDIVREVQTARFYQLLQEGGEDGVDITEVHGDAAFDDYVKSLEERAEQKRNPADFEPVVD